MIPTNDLRMFAKYKVIRTVRQSDGATLIATREVIDEKRPIRWDVEVTHPQQSSFTAPVMRIIEPPSTSKLVKKAAEEGYGDWYPLPEDAEPDPKDYLVD
jgi:hypothetical protein